MAEVQQRRHCLAVPEEARGRAKQAAIIAAFRQHVADVINGVTANQMAGANQAALGQDQLIRGV